jgi:hypothetical protein
MSKYSAAYQFTGFKYIRPNYDKPGSDKWSPDWLGYITPVGVYWNGTELIPFSGIQVSVIKVGTKLIARRLRPKPQYGWYGVYPDRTGGVLILRAITYLLNTDAKFLNLAHQDRIIQRYILVKPVKVGVR